MYSFNLNVNMPLVFKVASENDALSLRIKEHLIELVKKYLNDETSINHMYEMVNILDDEIGSRMYSPRYNRTLLLSEISEEDFNEKWERAFNQLDRFYVHEIERCTLVDAFKKRHNKQPNGQELLTFLNEIKRNMRLLDWLTYRTVLDLEIDLNQLNDRLGFLP